MTSQDVTLSMLLDRIATLEARVTILESNEVKYHKHTQLSYLYFIHHILLLLTGKNLEPTQQHLDIVLSQGNL